MELVAHGAIPENTTYERHPRVGPEQIDYQPDSPLHLRILSLSRTEPIAGLDRNARSTEYTYEQSLGEGIFIYQFDYGFDRDHPVSTRLVRSTSVVPSLPCLMLAHILHSGFCCS